MSAIPAGAKKSRDKIFYATAVLTLILAFVISGPMLNSIVNFTTAGGSPFEKIHPFVYVIALGWFFEFSFVRRFAIRRPDQYSGMAVAWFFLMIGLLGIGSAGYATTVLNNFFFPLILASQMMHLSENRVLKLGKIFLTLMVLQSALVFGEFALGRTLFPAKQEIAYFRPAGFSGHPLSAGQYALLAILTTQLVVCRPMISRLLLLLFLSSLLVIGSRSALLIGSLLVAVELLRPFRIRRTAWTGIFDFGAAIVAIFAVIAALALGGLDRFLERGIWDVSAQSRLVVFDVFDILNNYEVYYGIEYERLDMYLEFLRLNYVESPFVAQTVVGGVFFAFAAHLLIIAAFLPTLRANPLFFGTIMALLVSSLALSSKGTFPVLATVVASVTFIASNAQKEARRKSNPAFLSLRNSSP